LRGQALTLLSPKLFAQASYTINEHEVALDPASLVPPELAEFAAGDPILLQPKSYWGANITVQQSLFSMEALPALYGANRAGDAASLDEDMNRQRLRAGIARAYYGLFTAREGVSLAEDAERTTAHQLELALRQVDAGLAPPRARLQAELAVSRATRETQTARQLAAAAEEAFARYTGVDRDVPLTLPDPPPIPDTLEQAIALARIDHPDVLAADHRARAAARLRETNLAGFTPDVVGRFTYAYTENTGFSDDKTVWVAAIEGTWTLWDGGYRIAKSVEYASQVRAARLLVEQRKLDTEVQVRGAWESVQRSQAAMGAVQHEQALADESLRLAQLGFEAGTVTWLEVEQAVLGQRLARLNGISERMTRDLAAIDLLVAMGRY
jgi:outer membrane protein